jgi:hypothetical protein
MMNYDQELFMRTYNWLIEEKSFKEIFHQVFILTGRIRFVMAD